MKKRVLFVDDEPLVLEGLERTMRPLRAEWDMAFIPSGELALDAMAALPYDVVVSDMQMPGMSGAEFLRQVKERHPTTVRIALSGHADQELALRGMDAAHQYLSKPCDPALLKARIQQVGELGVGMADRGILGLVSRIDRFPSPPELYLRLVHAMETEKCGTEDLGRIVADDPGMSAKLLKLANSAFFGLHRQVASPIEAVAFLGADTLRSLVLAHGIFGGAPPLITKNLTIQEIWSHSLHVGMGAKVIAGMEGLSRAQQEVAYAAGLLHDLGILVLASWAPKEYDEILGQARAGEVVLDHAEQKAFGATHSDLGGYLMDLWGLPEALSRAAAFHHRPSLAHHASFSPVSAVHVAESLAWSLDGSPGFEAAQLDMDHFQAVGRSDRLEEWRQVMATACAEEAPL
ncbi:response regulator [Geothrix sp. 21YS21S-4]|uniref:response regulator n=1 Tax=Geothrix sp. 21YS21S-4 TaxID=3068889 RepID=UPI0027BA2987|nr:response regulator [Geothrix sp. 21YS21S-4]